MDLLDLSDDAAPVVAAAFQPPPFWVSNPRAWFAVLESHCATRNIKSSRTKFHHVVASLPEQLVSEVLDVIQDPPEEEPFEALRNAILDRTGSSNKERVRRLLQDMPLGDRKPSQLWRLMCNEMDKVPHDDALIKELWWRKLPQDVQFLLAPGQDLPMERLVEMADNAMQYRSPAVASIKPAAPSHSSTETLLQAIMERLEDMQVGRQPRGSQPNAAPQTNRRKRSRTPNTAPKLCWYHTRYGQDAKKCIQPCTWKGNKPGNDQADE